MRHYVAIVGRDPGQSEYGVRFPDFDGCVTGGESLSQAIERAHEILPFHVQGMREDGLPLPEPALIEEVASRLEPGEVPFLVTLVEPGKSVRVNFTIDERLLAEIDAYVQNHGQTRSAFLAEAARKVIDRAS